MATLERDSESDVLQTGNASDDPGTLIALIYRLTGDPIRALILTGLLTVVAGILILLVTATASVGLFSAVMGGVSGGAVLVGLTLRQVFRARRTK